MKISMVALAIGMSLLYGCVQDTTANTELKQTVNENLYKVYSGEVSKYYDCNSRVIIYRSPYSTSAIEPQNAKTKTSINEFCGE